MSIYKSLIGSKMPFVRRRRRYRSVPVRGRKVFRKRRRANAGRLDKLTLTRLRATQVFPDKLMVKLPYSTLLQRSPVSVLDEYVFRGNSCFDPDFTGTGAQPTGFDEYSAFYNEYRVFSSKIMVQIVNNIATGMNTTVLPALGSAGSGSFIGSVAQPYVRYRFAGGNSASNKMMIRNYMTTKKMYGRSVINEDNFTALVTANPNNPWYWVIESISSDGSTALEYDMLVRITYWVEFSSRKTLPLS